MTMGFRVHEPQLYGGSTSATRSASHLNGRAAQPLITAIARDDKP